MSHVALRLLLGLLLLGGSPAQPTDELDQLYQGREDTAKALAAALGWEHRLAARPDDYESAWKLGRACYWLGGHLAPAARRAQLERGIEGARRAVALKPREPEGHFWLAANLGTFAEQAGLRAGLRHRAEIKRELETVLALDPSFQRGSADRALGRWYSKVPRLFGGSRDKSVEHLERSLVYDPDSAASLSFLADTLLEAGRRDEARQVLQRVLAAAVDPEWAPETRDFKRQAAATLERLR